MISKEDVTGADSDVPKWKAREAEEGGKVDIDKINLCKESLLFQWSLQQRIVCN